MSVLSIQSRLTSPSSPPADNMTEASKKITYTSEFKLKVLDYYFKNGGDENFGLKKKTAIHFNINKKTINRQV